MGSLELKNRTKEITHRCIRLALSLPQIPIGNHIKGQIIRCATSVAANYRAALLAQTKAAFITSRRTAQKNVNQ
ncbi:MAG: four helix bundle protein [Proteobacteria bacterium]|nr:four helix bundle protein [Pseudomonadota bacterium]